MNKNAKIIFHVIEDNKYPSKLLKVQFSFLKEKITNLNFPYLLKDQYFSKLKDKIKTKIFLFLEKIKIEFPLTLYYGENHITIFKSKKIGVCYEIIKQLSYENKNENEIKEITFQYDKSNKFTISYFDTLDNIYRKRILVVNVPIILDLKNINFNKIKNGLSYKISIFPSNYALIQRIKEVVEHKIIEIDNETISDINIKIPMIFDSKTKSEEKEKLYNEIKEKVLSSKKYFNQDLIKLKKKDWDFYSYSSFYNFYRFHLLVLSKNEDINILNYFKKAIKIFEDINLQLVNLKLSDYEKILALCSLHNSLIIDCYDENNKNHDCGEYYLIDTKNIDYKCYKLSLEFINKIINNLREDSAIFYPILEANSGFSKNINSDDEKEIFEISMLNIENIKNHLLSLIPRIIFRVKNYNFKSKSEVIIKTTGTIFLYETTIFNNNLKLDIEDILDKYPEDSAIIISFTILHELFMHKKLRDNDEFVSGRETPAKFIGKKFKIENFYYTNIKNNLDCLSIYNKDENKLKQPSEDGECGRMFEYFFETPAFHTIYFLKNFLGLGELLNKVNLFVHKDFEELQKFILDKFKNDKLTPLMICKLLGIKENKILEYNEKKDIDINDNENNNKNFILDEYIKEIIKTAKIQI